MRISHSKLEEVRRDPKKYKKSLEGEPGFMGRPGRYRYWQLATRKYHSDGLENAEKHLVKLFRNFAESRKSDKLLEDHISSLHQYANDFLELENEVFKVRDLLDFEINYNNTLGGEIHRLDLSLSGGFEVYVMIKEDYIWENELRFPLIQHYYAKEFGCDYHDVKVGVYCFGMGEHVVNQYSDDEILKALKEINYISDILR